MPGHCWPEQYRELGNCAHAMLWTFWQLLPSLIRKMRGFDWLWSDFYKSKYYAIFFFKNAIGVQNLFWAFWILKSYTLERSTFHKITKWCDMKNIQCLASFSFPLRYIYKICISKKVREIRIMLLLINNWDFWINSSLWENSNILLFVI